jgi:hypothetical protein
LHELKRETAGDRVGLHKPHLDFLSHAEDEARVPASQRLLDLIMPP